MKSVGIRQAKSSFSRLMRAVRRGEEIVITDRGNPIAKIVPLTRDEETNDQWIARMVAEGRLTPAPPGARMPEPLPIEPSDIMQRILQEDRESGF
jgi:prevent-host-death family protein